MKREDTMYRVRLAEEARALAEAMKDPECRQEMLRIAEGYERLASRCAQDDSEKR